jgi:SAM-dependent methyltransferase
VESPGGLSALSDIRNPLFARLYARVLEPMAARDENRPRLLAGLEGRVLELGCGTGVNFPRYPDTVSEVVAVEPEPYLRRRALQAADAASVSVRVVAGQADALPLDDESVDAAVGELRRVLRPAGELRFYEHVVARNAIGRALQRAADLTFWPRAFGNCHVARDTSAAIAQAGFCIEQSERLTYPNVEPPHPHVLGVARRTGS